MAEKSLEGSSNNKASLPEGLLVAIKVARPIVIIAAIFYLLAAFTVVLTPDQIAQEAIGPDYNQSNIQAIRLTGWIFLIAGSLFIISIKLLNKTSTLKQLRLGSIIVMLSAFATIGAGRNVFSILVLLIITVPVYIVAIKSHQLIKQSK